MGLNTNQEKVVYTPSHDVLVSASAGTGKTTVLVARIINKIETDPGFDMSGLMAVTFSRTAAVELKEKIVKGINGEINSLRNGDNPEKEILIGKLRRQLSRISLAEISTIHSFCKKVVERYSTLLGMSPGLKIYDDVKMNLLMEDVARNEQELVLGSYSGYDSISPEDVSLLCDVLDPDGEKIENTVVRLYLDICSCRDGLDALTRSAEQYRIACAQGFEKTVWFETYLKTLERKIGYYRSVFEKAEKNSRGNGHEKNAAVYMKEGAVAGNMLDAVRKGDFTALKEACDRSVFNSGRLNAKENSDDRYSTFLKSEKSDFVKFCKALPDNLPDMEAENRRAPKLLRVAEALEKYLRIYDRDFRNAKRERGLVSYDDLETMAYSLLWDEEKDCPTDIAEKTARGFRDIFIDEYQDVNARQDRIFAALRLCADSDDYPTRFMVGDFKQSIYAFRGSDPKIFASYLGRNGTDVFHLNENYRCDSGVIGFTNRVCSDLFRLEGLGMPYCDEDDLIMGKDPEKDLGIEVEVNAVYGDSDRSIPQSEMNCLAVAERVKELVGSGEDPRSICVLLRNTKGVIESYKKALENLDIRYNDSTGDNLLSAPEVVFVLCLLQVIDNPYRDIPLAGVLKSPIYRFTLEELGSIRNSSKECSLYEALVAYTKEHAFEKGEKFLRALENYRNRTGESVDRLLWFIYSDTGIFAYAGQKKAEGKKDRLISLYSMALDFEKGNFHGLDSFVSYVSDIIADNGKLSVNSPAGGAAVTVMTIHKSKGLEFDNVIIADAGRELKYGDEPHGISFSPKNGLSFRVPEDDGYTYALPLPVLAGYLDVREEASEEIRNLYVALTRAKKRLIIYGKAGTSPSKDGENTEKLWLAGEFLSGEARTEWICANKDYYSWINALNRGHTEIACGSGQSVKEVGEAAEPDGELSLEFARRVGFKIDADSYLPAKLSVSRLRPDILDEFDNSEDLEKAEYTVREPAFIAGTELSATDYGTATHVFMQFCDLKLLRSKGFGQELGRLIGLGFISLGDAKLVRKKYVEDFAKSEICDEMLRSAFLKRELRFNVSLPAESFSSDEARKSALIGKSFLVQGVIDCVFENVDGTLTVLDYKTDRMPRSMYGSEKEFEVELIRRHSAQLNYYKTATQIVTGKMVAKMIIWSFALGRGIEI